MPCCWLKAYYDIDTSPALLLFQVIRNYHGHLSGVYCLALHPTLDLLMTGGRDSVCRVWDIRSKVQVFALSGHTNTVASVLTQAVDPQVGDWDGLGGGLEGLGGGGNTILGERGRGVAAMLAVAREGLGAAGHLLASGMTLVKRGVETVLAPSSSS